MRAALVLGLLAVIVVAALAEKTKDPASGEYDPEHPEGGHRGGHGKQRPHHGGHHGRKAPHRKTGKEGQHEGPRREHAGAAALKEEIQKIKDSDLPEDEKTSRLQALRQHVKNSQMIQSMPPEVRARHAEFQQAIKAIHEDTALSDEERQQALATEKQRFKTDMEELKGSISPEEIQRMRDERRKTIEGHTAAAVAAKEEGHHQMARKYYRRAKMAAKGHPIPPQQRKRRAPAVKRKSLSEPDFF